VHCPREIKQEIKASRAPSTCFLDCDGAAVRDAHHSGVQFQEQMGATDAATGSPRRASSQSIITGSDVLPRMFNGWNITVTQSVAVRHIHGRVEQALFSLFAQRRGSGNAGAVGTNGVNQSGINKSRTLSFRPSTCGDERRSVFVNIGSVDRINRRNEIPVVLRGIKFKSPCRT
jgi:hypothetical protein